MIVNPNAGKLVTPAGNVIRFPEPAAAEAQNAVHVTGPARCLNCRHGWTAVVPFETRRNPIECPSCAQMKGALIMPYVPPDGTPVWRCTCENDMFLILQTGVYCPNCGEMQRVPK